uniref:Uncharacterized protein n=1 Tax=Paramormyrops kingsleyae TaxID=1676925 RepID=A0A3B3SIJ6_9TELE
MKLLSAVLLFLIMTEVFCEEYDPSDYENDLIDRDQIQALNTILRRAARKPRPQQFFGLMGRRSSSKDSKFFFITDYPSTFCLRLSRAQRNPRRCKS